MCNSIDVTLDSLQEASALESISLASYVALHLFSGEEPGYKVSLAIGFGVGVQKCMS